MSWSGVGRVMTSNGSVGQARRHGVADGGKIVSKVRKLCTGSAIAVRYGPWHCAVSIGYLGRCHDGVRFGFGALASSSSNSMGLSRWRMCHST